MKNISANALKNIKKCMSLFDIRWLFGVGCIHVADKVWGKEHWMINNKDYCGKMLYLNTGYRCSTHYHKIKHEIFHLQSGLTYFEKNRRGRLMVPGDYIEIPTGTKHRFTGLKPSVLVEFSTHHEDSDSYRTTQSEHVPIREYNRLFKKYVNKDTESIEAIKLLKTSWGL